MESLIPFPFPIKEKLLQKKSTQLGVVWDIFTNTSRAWKLRGATTGVTEPVNYASFGRIIATDLNFDPVAGKDPNEVLPDLAGDIAEDKVLVVEADTEHAVGEGLSDETLVDPFLLAGLVGGGWLGGGGEGRQRVGEGEGERVVEWLKKAKGVCGGG